MKLTEAFQLAIKNIRGSRMRTFLTMLGIIIGIAAVIVIVGLGNGMENYMKDSFADMGTNTLIVSIKGRGSSRSVSEEQMYDLVAENPDYLDQISPTVSLSSGVKIGTESLSSTTVTGVSETYFNMLIFVVGIISIDIIQEWKTDKTLNALKDLSAPHITVIRDGAEHTIASADLVPGDLMMIYEGVKIPADGSVVRCNDLCVDESSLTGEAEGVWKIPAESTQPTADYWRRDYCYAGTLVTQGTATVLVDKIGSTTEYGKIGVHVAAAPEEPTPLQKQTRSLVKLCAGIAAVLFALVGIFT